MEKREINVTILWRNGLPPAKLLWYLQYLLREIRQPGLHIVQHGGDSPMPCGVSSGSRVGLRPDPAAADAPLDEYAGPGRFTSIRRPKAVGANQLVHAIRAKWRPLCFLSTSKASTKETA